ncbi:putative ribonuclease H-like domain-containing protein [Tanacetum coccineum]|uniref:Ribonuclease H-like domain-containing protein n=1 Tax=Tanacetum coccineum TaxID=301880 RepID=A0ABQ5D7M8_9ASTR
MTPRAVMLKSGLKPLNTVRPFNTGHPKPIVNYAKPMPYFSNQAQTTVRRPFYKRTVLTNRHYNQRFNTVRPFINAARANGFNAVKPSACWVWRPTKPNSASLGYPQMNDKGFVNSGCSRHMTGNLAYLSNFKEYDGGNVTFGGRAYRGRITVPKENLTCLVAKATTDESMLWHRRLGYINLKNINKLVKENLVRGLPLKQFVNDQTCVACLKEIENQVYKKVKIIRSDNGTEFKNRVLDEFCKEKGIKREYSVARTPQQNRVAERRNRTLIEAARTMVLIVKPHNKTLYELFKGLKPALNFMKPFGCHVTILNTLDHLGKFDRKSDNGFFVGYSLSSKSFRVYNTRTRKVEENLHVWFLDNKPMIEGSGPEWLFDIDSLTKSMNYVPVSIGTTFDESACTQDDLSIGTLLDQGDSSKDCVVMPIWKDTSYFDSSSKHDDKGEPKKVDPKKVANGLNDESNDKEGNRSSKEDNNVGQQINTASPFNTGSPIVNTTDATVNPADHDDSFGDDHSFEDSYVEFLSDDDEPEIEPNRVTKALSDPAWVEAMQEELLQFELQKIDERGIVIRNKARLVAQGHTQEKGIDYDDVFAPVAKIEAIRLFLAYASFMGFMVYQMDVLYGLHQALRAWYETLANYLLSNGFQRGKINPTLFIKRQKCDILLVQVYVDDIIFGSTKKEMCDDFEKLMKDKFQMSSMGELTFFLGLQVKQKKDGIFISLDKYVAEILRKFNYTDVKSASITIDLEKPFTKDGDAEDVNVYLYRSMIGSLMYLIASMPDIIYLKGKPTLGLWYARDSSFELVAYTDSDYAGATQDRKFTTGGC